MHPTRSSNPLLRNQLGLAAYDLLTTQGPFPETLPSWQAGRPLKLSLSPTLTFYYNKLP